MWPALPTCESYRDGENIVDHGARVLIFLLDTGCTATLSDLELERAEIAAKYAITARGIHVLAATRLSDARHVIALILTARRTAEKVTAQPGRGLDQRPNLGPMAKVLDTPILNPRTPAGMVEVQF